jgi:outer membrane protein assembly factor BamB
MKFYFIIFLFIVFSLNLRAQVVQWRGPNRDGIFHETGLLKQWPENGPAKILEVEKIGKGWSSPIYAGEMIYTTGMIDTLDYLSAIDMKGNIKWQVSYGRSWNQSYPDTRSTPVVDDDRIYVQSGTGRVACINKDSGKEIWAKEVDKDFNGVYHIWGNSETPLIFDNMVICSPGGNETSIVALDKMTGNTIWESKSVGGPRAYLSATIYNYKNFRYVLAATGTHLLALTPETGDIVWSYKYYDAEKWDQDGLIWTNTPTYKDDDIFISMGYDYPAVMLKMSADGKSVSEKFSNIILDNHFGGLILSDGYVYGANWTDNNRGKWVCMDWNTGEIKYETDWDTKGSLVMADGLLYAYNERGNVGLIEPNPDSFKVVSQFKLKGGAGPHWAHPFIADGKLFLRHGEVLFVYDIKEK